MLNEKDLKDRARIVAEYIVENKATVRQAAQVFGISKTTAYEYVTARICKENPKLYLEVQTVLRYNKNQRAIRGGMATKARKECKK